MQKKKYKTLFWLNAIGDDVAFRASRRVGVVFHQGGLSIFIVPLVPPRRELISEIVAAAKCGHMMAPVCFQTHLPQLYRWILHEPHSFTVFVTVLMVDVLTKHELLTSLWKLFMICFISLKMTFCFLQRHIHIVRWLFVYIFMFLVCFCPFVRLLNCNHERTTLNLLGNFKIMHSLKCYEGYCKSKMEGSSKRVNLKSVLFFYKF